jgi:beta-lactamase class A
LGTGRVISLITTQASLIKVPILVTAFSQIQAGALKLAAAVGTGSPACY